MLTNGFIKQAQNVKTIDDLLGVKSDCYMTLDKLLYHIVHNDHEILRGFLDQVSVEDQESLMELSPVSDISDIEIVDVYIDDHEFCTKLTFSDESGKLRSAQLLWDTYVPGMAHYYQESSRIKQDLIDLINHYYRMKCEGRHPVSHRIVD